MRKSAIGAALLTFAIALAAAADDHKPVFITKNGIQEAALPWRFIDSPIHPVDARRVTWHAGWVEVKTPIGPLRIFLLPIMMPLSGAPGSRDWQEMPNPFKLTGTQIPQRPPAEPQTDIIIQTAPRERDASSDRKASPPSPPDSGAD